MKTLKTIIFASAALFATVACTKEANPKESVPSAPGTIEVNVTALIGDLAPSEGTKATMDPVIRLTWKNNDKVYAYDATQKLGDLTVTPVEGSSSAKLTGTLTKTPAENTKKITLVYCNTAASAPTIDGSTGKITFDLGTQDVAANPFVVYATLDYTAGLTSINNKIVPFSFATSLMRVTVTGLANKDITNATVSGVNTKCELAVSATGEPTVSGTTPGNITRAAAGITKSDDGRAVFNVSVAAEEENTGRKLTIEQGTLKYGSDLMSQAIAAGTSIISVYALTEQTGSRGTINDHDYVYVAGKKWATQNLAISNSGKGAWLSAKVPGTTTEEKIVIGDYFQWGVYPNHTTPANDQGLLIYESFDYDFFLTVPSRSNQENSSTLQPHHMEVRHTPNTSMPTNHTGRISISATTSPTPSGGDTWRMPISQEFIELCAACFVEWDGTNKGLLFYAPKSAADKGLLKLSETKWKQITGTAKTYSDTSKPNAFEEYTDAVALLFFPAAGDGYGGSLYNAGTSGDYWSSTLRSDDTDYAYRLSFSSGGVNPRSYDYRYIGFSVRPLSD